MVAKAMFCYPLSLLLLAFLVHVNLSFCGLYTSADDLTRSVYDFVIVGGESHLCPFLTSVMLTSLQLGQQAMS